MNFPWLEGNVRSTNKVKRLIRLRNEHRTSNVQSRFQRETSKTDCVVSADVVCIKCDIAFCKPIERNCKVQNDDQGILENY